MGAPVCVNVGKSAISAAVKDGPMEVGGQTEWLEI